MVEIADFQTHHGQLRAQMADIWTKIQGLNGNYAVRRDLVSLHSNLRLIWAKMDNEMIECRKRNRATSNYTELSRELAKYLKIMDREVFWQQLH